MRPLLILCLLVAACERRPPAPSAEQNRQLDDAENMLDDMAEGDNAAG